MLPATSLLLLLAAPPGTGLETNLEEIDRPAATTQAADQARLEARLVSVFDARQPLSLPVGHTAFVEAVLTLELPPSGAPTVQVQQSTKSGLVVLPVVTVEALSQGKKSTARIRFAVRNQSLEGATKLDLRLLVGQMSGRPDEAGAAINDLSLLVNGLPAKSTLGDIQDDQRSFLLFQQRAQIAYQALPKLHDYLRLDRVDRPPSASRVKPSEKPILSDFVKNRLYADCALFRLRTTAESPDLALQNAAILAIGGLSKRPGSIAKKARSIEGLTTQAALDATWTALSNLEIDQAEGNLDKLRTSGRLNRVELGEALELQGGVDLMRGRSESAKLAYGRARCLDPARPGRLDRPFFRDAFEEAKQGGCRQTIEIKSVEATRIGTADGLKISVVARFGPDPYRLVSGGEIQLWGSGGAVHSAERIRTSEDGQRLEAEFDDHGDLENYVGQALVKVILRELSGVPVATLGDPDPIPLTITDGEGTGGLAWPWYVWAIAGGVLVVGAATAGLLVATGQDETRGIGPIGVSF